MTIAGQRTIDGRLNIWIDGRRLTPQRSQKLWNHSPDGFECGYEGSGPAQLALAILLAAGVSDDAAVTLHQPFKREFVARWQPSFSINLDVRTWAARRLRHARRGLSRYDAPIPPASQE